MSKSIPDVRFEKFGGDWEKRKLGDVAEFNPKSIIPEVFEYIDLGSVLGTILTSHRTEYKNTAPSRAQRLAKQGDVFYQTVRPYQKNNYLYNLPYDNYVFSTGYTQMRPYVDSYFLLSILQENDFVLNVLERSTGTSYPAINSNDLSKMYIKVPISKNEQQKIGALFKQLDDTIALQQQLVKQQQQYKKAMLQKMFPQKGESVPKVRFDGFSEDWTELKMGEVFEQTNEYINPQESNLELFSLTVEKELTQKTARYNREFLVKKTDKFKKVGPNEFVYNPMNMTLGAVGFNDSKFSVAVSGYYVTMKIKMKCNNEYFRRVLTSPQAIRLYKLYATGSLIEKQRVQFPTFSEIRIKVPVLEEQQKIGAFFKQLDDTMALHQKKLEDYQQLKKALLQRMFV